jgi:hypothetical protein
MSELEESIATDIVRLSVPVPTAELKKDYVVELNLRRFKIRTFPKIKYN